MFEIFSFKINVEKRRVEEGTGWSQVIGQRSFEIFWDFDAVVGQELGGFSRDQKVGDIESLSSRVLYYLGYVFGEVRVLEILENN